MTHYFNIPTSKNIPVTTNAYCYTMLTHNAFKRSHRQLQDVENLQQKNTVFIKKNKKADVTSQTILQSTYMSYLTLSTIWCIFF